MAGELDPTELARVLRPAFEPLVTAIERPYRVVQRSTAGGDRIQVERTRGTLVEPRLEMTPMTPPTETGGMGDPLVVAPPRWVNIGHIIPVTSTGTMDVADSQKLVVPVWFPEATTIDNITVELTALTQSIEIVATAIYSSNAGGLPDQRVAVASAYQFSSVGIKTIPLSFQFAPMTVYWLFCGFYYACTIRSGVPAKDIIGSNVAGDVNRCAALTATAAAYSAPQPWNHSTMPLSTVLNRLPWFGLHMI